MARNNELIRLAKKAAGTWRNTHEYQQAAQIIDMLVDELEKSTLTQPNEALTLEKLENMEDTTPVWWDQINSWVLVYKGNLTTWSGKHLYAKGSNGKFYRRPPEGDADA